MKKLTLLLSFFFIIAFSTASNAWVTMVYSGVNAYVYSQPSNTRIASCEPNYNPTMVKVDGRCRVAPYWAYAPTNVNADILYTVNYAIANGVGWRWGQCGGWANPNPCLL
jgi:hypothetical protein